MCTTEPPNPRLLSKKDTSEKVQGTLAKLVLLRSLEKQVSISIKLEGEMRKDLIEILKVNVHVFALSHEDVLDIDPKIMVHRLNVDPSFQPLKHRFRPVNTERVL